MKIIKKLADFSSEKEDADKKEERKGVWQAQKRKGKNVSPKKKKKKKKKKTTT